MDSVRVDRWLCAARIYKSRAQATEACVGGHVRVNGNRTKPHHALRIGDEVRVQKLRSLRVLEVVGLADKRLSPPQARELYQDHSPPPPPREERLKTREPGAGRPTKRDLRRLQRLRGRD